MKGFNTSTDYSKLWDFIHNGFRVPAWILYKKYEEPIFDIVEVKMPKYGDYPSIGVRGHGYETMDNNKEDFIENCKSLELLYVIPQAHA